MTEQEIIEGNRLIAEFMGGTTTTIDTCANHGQMQIPEWAFILYDFDTLKLGAYGYNSSWDWLMPVVEKIEKLPYTRYVTGGFSTAITSSWSFISPTEDGLREPEFKSMQGLGKSKIQAVYDTVIQFIQWHNNQPKKS